MEYQDAIAARHSAYMLDDRIEDAGVSADDVLAMLRSIAPKVPSSYNSQSARLILLTGEDHRRFWGIVEEVLRAKVDDDKRFARTEVKLRGFAAAAGTVLFYEIDSVTEGLKETYPSYADVFPTWAEHGNAMIQFAVWTGFYDLGLAANIQHYNPIIDARVADEFSVPEGYRLVAQMVFGRETQVPAGKPKLSGEDMVSVGRAGGASE